ncbi:MAG TPA: sulfurtransferase [Candidatus Rubrimentiphilum sp.]|nr:sulfurtransferase [Candidatus Rubrimentiphilum sp.]
MFRTIVSVEELAEHIGDRGWVVIDCRHSLQDHGAGGRAYGEGHIPGAFFANVETDLAGKKTGKNGRHPLPDPHELAAFLAELGVTPQTQIVAYDAGADMFAARLWFLCKYIGHDSVAVLNGGFAAWTSAGKPVETKEPARPKTGTIAPQPRRELTADADAVLESLETKELVLLDARAADRFAGQNETIDRVAGHIPGALNRPFKTNFNERGMFKSPEELRAEYAQLGVEPRRLVHQCGSGVSSAVNLLAMEIAGVEGSRLYPGSWSEWIADPARPIATG